jgi:hypothetical protein
MRNFFGIILALLFGCAPAAFSATIVSGTLSVTNYSALTNATSGQSYTLNGDTRTFTNSLANAATQIRVRTNDSAATITMNLAAQAGLYRFADITSITASAGTNVTFRATNDVALTITLSPTNWGRVTYSTQTVGVAQSVVEIPMSAWESSARAPNASQLWSDLDQYSTNRNFAGLVSFDDQARINGGLGVHGRGLVSTNYTLGTNDLYIGADTRSNTNLILTLPGAAAASNLLFLIKDEGGAAGTNTLKIYPQSGDRIDGLTNLTIAANFGNVTVRSRGGTNYAVIASGAGVTGSMSGGGSGIGATELGFVTLTNGAATVASTNVATNSLIFLTRYASDGTVLPVDEVAPRILGTSFAVAASATNDAVVSFQLINSGPASPIPTVGTNYLHPNAYLRFDETNAMDVAVDIVGGQNFTNGAGVVSSVAGIITNAYQLERPNGDDFLADASASSYDFGTNDFAIRMWLRPHSTNANDGYFLYSGGSPTSWYGWFTNSLAGATNRVSWQAVDPSAVTTSLNSTNDLAGDTWHRVILWHKQGVELGLKVDNQPSETMTFTNLMASTGVPLELYVTGTGNRIDYDEIAVWKGYVPTEGEWSYDWNSGAGRTYPLH